MLVPLSQFYELAEIGFSFPCPGMIEARLQPGDLRLIIESDDDTLTLGKRRIPVMATARASSEGEIYLSSASLGSLLNVRFVLDWSDLNVPWPILSACLSGAGLPARPPVFPRGHGRQRLACPHPGPAALNGLVFDYSLLSPMKDAFWGSSFATALGAEVLGGSLEMGLASTSTVDAGDRADASWTGVWRQNQLVRQLRLGDGLATGPRPRSVRGFAVSNAPFQRPALLGEVPYMGHLGPGWEIEAYRGGRLVAFDSVDGLGQFSVDVPVQYGENPVDFIAYGPFGEVREFNQTYRIVSNALPRERFEWSCCRRLPHSRVQRQCQHGPALRPVPARHRPGGHRPVLAGHPPDLFHPYAAVSGNWGMRGRSSWKASRARWCGAP